MKSKIKYTLCILLSSLFTFFVCDAGNTVFKQLDAAYDGIQLKLEDDIVKFKDTNDNPIEIFTVDGTAYLPARAVSELMEIECTWNGDLKQIEIHDPKRRFPRQLDLNEVDWLSYQLRSFNEVGLYAFRHDKGREYFRFLYLPSFTEPCLIDIYLHNGKYELSFKKTNGAGGFYAGELHYGKNKGTDSQRFRTTKKQTRRMRLLGSSFLQWDKGWDRRYLMDYRSGKLWKIQYCKSLVSGRRLCS